MHRITQALVISDISSPCFLYDIQNDLQCLLERVIMSGLLSNASITFQKIFRMIIVDYNQSKSLTAANLISERNYENVPQSKAIQDSLHPFPTCPRFLEVTFAQYSVNPMLNIDQKVLPTFQSAVNNLQMKYIG